MTARYSFVATEAGVEENEDCLVATLDSGDDAYIMFQRHRNFGSADDEGIYVEIGDQINANCGCVESCSVTTDRFSLQLTSPLLDCNQICADLSLPETQLQTFLATLQRVFTGHEGLLKIEIGP